MLLLLAVGALFSPLHAQVSYDFTRVEYFFDSDPGFGQGTAVTLPASPGTALSNLSFSASLAPLTPGFHSLFIRSRAATGYWSQTYRQLLYKEPTSAVGAAPNIAAAEYFMDADPGYGAGTAISITGGGTNAAGVSFAVGLGSVAPGFRALSVRSKNANGVWSQTYRQIFYVEPRTTATPPASLAAVEYFVDADPGYGQGTSAAITGGGTNATGVSFTVGLGSLSVGFHTLFYRVRDAAGKWSQTQNRIFYVDDLTVATVPVINKAEYFFDTDPGYGQGVNVPISTPSTNLTSLNLLADASVLPTGQHRLFVRTRDASGGWSQVLSRPFAKSGCNNSPNYAAGQPSASYTGFGITSTAVEQMFNGSVVTDGSSTFLNNYYAQVDLGASTLRTISEVQLSLRNVNSTAVNYTLTVEASGNLSTWNAIDTYSATLPANQTTPTSIVRTLATVQNNVRGLRLRLTLPTVSQGIQLTNAGAYYFPTTCAAPVIISFTPGSGPAGATVTITGTDLGGATAVTFNGTPAGPITNNTSTSLTVAAPAGGTDGQICVTTPGGTACSATSYLYPATIATGTVSPSAYCTGNTLTVPFSTNTARYATGNVFNFQLSDASGVFAANAPLLGTLQSSNATGGVLTGTIPQSTPAGSGYRVRVVASSPAVMGTDNGANLTIGTTPVSQATGPATVANGATIALSTTPTYAGATYSWSGPGGFSSTLQSPSTSTTTAGTARYSVTVTLGRCSYSSFVDVNVQASTIPMLSMSAFSGSLCLGASHTVSFIVSGNPYPAGNTITAQLSDANGSFAAPVSIGSTSFSGQGNGALTATIPASATAGSGYRIRVVSSSPVVISNDNGTNLTLNDLPAVTVSSNSPVAQGGTLVLNGGPAVAGNVFTAQLSAAGGSFASPVSIGTLTSATLGTIAAIIPAGTALGTAYRIRAVGSQPATVGSDNGADISIGAANAYTWLGAVSTAWNNAANWSCNAVPTATTNVVIPAGLSLYPVAGAGSTAQSLSIASGASLTLSGQFTLTGNLTNNGTFTPNANALVCGGSTAQTLGGTGALRFYDLTINNAAGATLTSATGVQHVLMLTSGNLASGNNLTLLSDANNTAMVVNPAGGGVVMGRATMERFIMSAGAVGYRHYSSPMQTGTATVQEFADDVPNFNVNPDYNTQGNTALPFPTLFQYDEGRLTAALPTFDQGWLVPGANDNLTPGRGYSAQTLPGTVVDISGTLTSASVSYPLGRAPLAEAGWHLLGNPFPSPLDWDQVPAVAGVGRAIYVFVPSGPYSDTYRSYVGGIGQNGGTKDLAAMQGFFVRATAAASLTLPATARPSAYLNPGFNRTSTTTTRPLVRLQAKSANGPADETVVYFDPAATPGFDTDFDAYKVQLNGNGAPSLWSQAGADGLSINALPSLATVPSIPLGVRVGQAGSHTLSATELLNLPPGTEVWLEDRALGTRQNLTLTPAYTFSMSPGYTGQRFYL